MNNPILDLMRGSAPVRPDFWSAFQSFRKSVTGNPKDIVQQLVASGRMSQEQLQQYGQMASSILKK